MCVCLCACGCILKHEWFVLCRNTVMHMWEDELRQRERRNAVVTLVSSLCRKCDTFICTHARTYTLDCGAAVQWPQLLVCRKLLLTWWNKVPTPYACGSQTLSSIFHYFICIDRWLLRALCARRIEMEVDRVLCIQRTVLIMLFMDAKLRLTNSQQRQRSDVMVSSAGWFIEQCRMYSAFSCTFKLTFPISISLSRRPTLNQQLTTSSSVKFTGETRPD